MSDNGGTGMLRRLGESDGFTIAEVLIAMMLLMIGFVGVVGGLGAHSGAVGDASPRGLAGITRGNYVATATMLAQQRMEQLKQLTYQIGPPAVDQFGTGSIPTGFADEATGTIAGYPNFSRQVRMQHNVPVANMKTITVTINYRLPTERGSNGEAIVVSTLFAAAP